ncbi:MAG: hypothetical protein L0H94_01950 [Nitrospira sp.]|nr:hypothetical protein [Nitrospira sp.]
MKAYKGSQMNEAAPAPIPKNDPKLMRQVRVKVLRCFCVNGKPLSVGDEVMLEYHVARDLAVFKKVEMFLS